MKNLYILWIAMFVVASSCQRSQFSATTRQCKNGKVTYVNNYHKERSKISKGKSPKSQIKEIDAQNSVPSSARTGVQNFTEPEITKINSVPESGNENLIASTSNQTTIIAMTENQLVPEHELILSKNNYNKGAEVINHHDTISIKKSKKEKINVPSGRHVIFFKSGKKETARIISRSHDTLFYTSIKKSDVVAGVKMEQIDTILWVPFGEQVIKYKSGKEESVNIISKSHDTIFYTLIKKPDIIQSVKAGQIDTIVEVKYYDSVKGKVVDIRKNEPFSMIGFISSILGLVPVFGLPFALVGLFFGFYGLKKIRRSPLRYKGTKFAKASIAIGIIGLIISLIFIFISITSALIQGCEDLNSIHF